MNHLFKYFFAVCILFPSLIFGQNITQAEYFFDTDPGIGNANSIAINTPSDSIDFDLSINTTGLAAGHHNLFVRTKDDREVWSMAIKQHVFVSTTIVDAEYFYDSDPGIGNGTSIPIPATVDSIDFDGSLSTSGLSPGHHWVYVRTKDNNDQWSAIGKRHVFVSTSIVAAEYFYDSDPGIGNGTAIPVTATLDSIDLDAAVSTSGLSSGHHVLYVRTQGADGNWSLIGKRNVFVNQSIVAAEYFFDEDPGIGLANSIPITSTLDSIDLDASINITGVEPGFHQLYVRTKNDAGKWSHHTPRRVFIEKEIVAAEYFFDIDLGVGLATSMVVGNIADSVDWDLSFIMPYLPQGDHKLYIRTKDSFGVWSHYSLADTVEVESPVGVSEEENSSFDIYANVGVLYIRTALTDIPDAQFKLYDLLGKEVASKSHIQLNQGTNSIPLNGLAPATYLAEIKSQNIIYVQKVVLK